MQYFAWSILTVLAAAPGPAPVAREVVEAGQRYVDLDNGLVALRLEPGRGARIVRFVPAWSGVNWVHPEPAFGMALDHFAGQGHPGELDTEAYACRVLTEPAAPGVEAWALTRHGHSPSVPKGLEVRKRITLRPDRPVVHILYTLTNTAPTAVRVGFMPKFDVYIGGDRTHNRYCRPTTRGLDIAWHDHESRTDHGEHFVRTPLAGWTAAVDIRRGEGLVFLMDYNYLQWLYNCLSYNTVEWLYDRVTLPPAASWKTEVRLVPVRGFRQVTHASSRLVADTEVTEDQGHIRVAHRWCAVEADLTDVVVRTRLQQIVTLRQYTFPEIRLAHIGSSTVTADTAQKIDEHSGLTVTVSLDGRSAGEPFHEEYDYYYRGREGGGFDLLSSRERGYVKAAPRKHKQFADARGLTYRPARPGRVFEMRGIYGRLFQLPEAVGQAGMVLDRVAGARCSWDGHSVDYFPFDPAELFGFRVVVINSIDAQAIDDEMQHLIRQYVSAGGSLLVLGGYYSFGVGGWHELGALHELLPVQISGPFDLKPLTPPAPIAAVEGGLYTPADVAGLGPVAWIHELAARPGARTELTAGTRPMLVTGRYGRGRVAALAGTVLGTPPAGQVLFWQSPVWPTVLGRLLAWLSAAEQP